ncbi:hypothetical protein IU429_04680 [Nocardia elegans]|uniref:Uncharacterized protein n=1 Tax=Nocardia elegans TaxID=300029 RepID=A0ABW6T772_9NOCA|nr:hypothetical protein [Nocardia elegans]MBF6446953.1 hypothetical protein [Nocardia elegans]
MTTRPIVLMICLFVAAVTVSGCSSPVAGTASPAEIDVRTLDMGSYSSDKPRVARTVLPGTLPVLEGVRFADAVISPFEVEPRYKYGMGAKLEMTPDVVTAQLPSFVQPILEKYGMLMAFRAAAADSDSKAGESLGNGAYEGMSATVIRFPDDNSAKAAARELDAVDLARNTDNESVMIPDFPDAFSHWRPSVPTIGVSAPHGPFVIAVYAGRHSVDKDALISMCRKYLSAQVKSLDNFHPTPVANYRSLAIDPDHMLTRVFHGFWIPEVGGVLGPEEDVVYTDHAFLHFQSDLPGRAAVIHKAGVDRVAVASQALLFRARDEAAAQQFLVDVGTPKNKAKDVPPPRGVPGAICSQNETGMYKFQCYVSYRRYVAQVKSEQLIDVQQRAAAQYALLAKNQ